MGQKTLQFFWPSSQRVCPFEQEKRNRSQGVALQSTVTRCPLKRMVRCLSLHETMTDLEIPPQFVFFQEVK